MLKCPLSGALGADSGIVVAGTPGGLLAVFTFPGLRVGTAPVVKRAVGAHTEGLDLLLQIQSLTCRS